MQVFPAAAPAEPLGGRPDDQPTPPWREPGHNRLTRQVGRDSTPLKVVSSLSLSTEATMVTTRSNVQEPLQGEGNPPPPSQSSNDREMLMSLHQRMDALTAMVQNLQRAPQPSPPEVQIPLVGQPEVPAPPAAPSSHRDQRFPGPRSHRPRAPHHSRSSSPRTQARSRGDSRRNKCPQSPSISDDVS